MRLKNSEPRMIDVSEGARAKSTNVGHHSSSGSNSSGLPGGTARNRKIVPASHSLLTSCDFEAFVSQAKSLNQQNQATFATPFPKHDSRWISHYQSRLRPITFTNQGTVEGGLSWLVGATLDFSFVRDLCAGAIRTLGQLPRRACNFVLDATYTLGRLHPLRT